MQTRTATIIDLGSVRVTRQVPINSEQEQRRIREEAEWQAQVARIRATQDAAKFASLGDRLGAVIEGDISPMGEGSLEAVGKTVAGVEDAIAAYVKRWDGPYAAAFYSVQPWGQGFRATGHRWDRA